MTTQASPPPSWPGLGVEWLAAEALDRAGFQLGDDYDYQTGPRPALGGIIVDFLFKNPSGLGISVASTQHNISQRTRNLFAKKQLEGMGIRIVFIQEFDLRRDADFYVKEALAGRDHSTLGR